MNLPPPVEYSAAALAGVTQGWTLPLFNEPSPRIFGGVLPADNRPVVVKRFDKADEFTTELGRLIVLRNHPHVVAYIGWCREPVLVRPVLAIVFPLHESLDANNIGNFARRDMIAGLAHALQVAHENGIVFGDLKPGNLLWDSDANRGRHTDLAEGFCTVPFLPPESERTRPWVPDASGDVYAFGLTVACIFNGLVHVDHKGNVIQPPILCALVRCIKDSWVQTVVKEMTRYDYRPDMETVVNALQLTPLVPSQHIAGEMMEAHHDAAPLSGSGCARCMPNALRLRIPAIDVARYARLMRHLGDSAPGIMRCYSVEVDSIDSQSGVAVLEPYVCNVEALAPDDLLPISIVFYLMGGVCSGLHELHLRGYAHGNVNLANVLLVAGTQSCPPHAKLSFSTSSLGTPQKDLVGMGYIVYELLTGRPPDGATQLPEEDLGRYTSCRTQIRNLVSGCLRSASQLPDAGAVLVRIAALQHQLQPSENDMLVLRKRCKATVVAATFADLDGAPRLSRHHRLSRRWCGVVLNAGSLLSERCYAVSGSLPYRGRVTSASVGGASIMRGMLQSRSSSMSARNPSWTLRRASTSWPRVSTLRRTSVIAAAPSRGVFPSISVPVSEDSVGQSCRCEPPRTRRFSHWRVLNMPLNM